jgi:hypothetical protein
MSDAVNVIEIREPDGKLRYDWEAAQAIAVRVALYQRNGTRKCPVELLHEGRTILSTDADLRTLRDIESLFRHASTLLKDVPTLKDVPWLDILTAVAKKLPKEAPKPWTPVTLPLSAHAIERRAYWWYPWLPQGEPVSIEGDPNAGKTAVMIKICAHLTSGQRFPTLFADHPEEDFPPQRILLFTYEDDPHTTLHPRLVINGGNPDLVEMIKGKRDPDTGAVVPLTLQDLPQLEALLKQHRPALMTFDPLQSFLGAGVNMNAADETRPMLDAVSTLCKRYGCTPCYIRHHGKTDRDKAIHSALGSIDITAGMRSCLGLYSDRDEPQRRILAHTKKNGRPAPSMQLRIVGTTLDVPTDEGFFSVEEVRVDWDGLSELTVEDLNARQYAHGGDSDEANTALDQARAFLRDMLGEGPVLVDVLRQAARDAGITWATLRRAKDREHVRAQRGEEAGISAPKQPWQWQLPDTQA